jgi:hypothetical protein
MLRCLKMRMANRCLERAAGQANADPVLADPDTRCDVASLAAIVQASPPRRDIELPGVALYIKADASH